MSSRLSCQKVSFSLPDEVTYLNCAYMSPLLKSAEEAGIEGLQLKRAPYNLTLHHFFDQVHTLRETYARLIHINNPNRIVIMPSVSYGMGIVAKNLNLSRGENIVVAAEQFPSNIYPWMSLTKKKGGKLKIVSPPNIREDRGKKWNEALLEAITDNTKLVAISHVHWADGTLFNIQKIRERTRDVGSLLVIDGTQSVGALPFNVTKIQPDALICSSYKWLLGPYGLSIGYFSETFDGGQPLEEAWINRYESENFEGLVNYQDDYQKDALRYEGGGRSNFISVPILQAALNALENWGIENIQEYAKKLIDEPVKQLQDLGCIVENPEYRSAHLFGIRLTDAFDTDKLKAIFKEKKIYVSFRGSAIRVSPYLYNEKSDLEKLVRAIEKAKK